MFFVVLSSDVLTSFQENKSPCELSAWFKALIVPRQREDREHEHCQVGTAFKRGLLHIWVGFESNSCRRKTAALKHHQSGVVSYLHCRMLHNSGQMA